MSDPVKLIDLFREINKECSNEMLCKMTDEQSAKLNDYLERLIELHGQKSNKSSCAEKGKALENYAKFLLEVSG